MNDEFLIIFIFDQFLIKNSITCAICHATFVFPGVYNQTTGTLGLKCPTPNCRGV